jgi:hypothetical protein
MWRREENRTRKRRRGCFGRQVCESALCNYNWEKDNGLRNKEKEKRKNRVKEKKKIPTTRRQVLKRRKKKRKK